MSEFTFRDAMRRLASGVSLITCGDKGMAATAVMSLSAEPPTLAIAVNKSASISGPLASESAFCVNILGEGHEDLVKVFSGGVPPEERFGHGNWVMEEGVPPVLADAQASLVCTIEQRVDAHSHILYIGRVTAVTGQEVVAPLIWADGGFKK